MKPSPEDMEKGLQETRYLLRSPANAIRLLQSIAEAEKGSLVERDIPDHGASGK